MMMKVTHLITGLGKGGAETMLYQILKYKINPSIEYCVISMGGASYYEEQINKLGIVVYELSFRKRPIRSIIKIVSILRENKTDVLCCWMYHANFVGYIAGKFAGIKKIVWNIRHSNLSTELNKKSTLILNNICSKLSKKVSVITYNGTKSKEEHIRIGYCNENCIILENGVDLDEYKSLPDARKELFEELGIGLDSKIMLSVARYHPIKDIPLFIRSFTAVHQQIPNTVAVMCGNGIECNNQELIELCSENGLTPGKDVYLLGLRHDIPKLMSSSNVYVLHSAGEAFPNTLVQAMACGCICVTTDVGEAARIIDNKNRVVQPGNWVELSSKMIETLTLDKEYYLKESKENQQKISNSYSIGAIILEYEKLYQHG